MHGPADRAPGPAWYKRIGPGIISGAANDDPSCIVTYSMAGAAFGYLTLWTSLFCLPLIAAVQLVCARLGMVSGRGLVGAVRVRFPRWVLLPTCALLFLANVVTIGADLSGMAEVAELVTGLPAWLWTPAFAGGIVAMLFYFSHRRIMQVFRWLCLALFAYVAAGFLAAPDWGTALFFSVVPGIDWSGRYFAVIVAILGATMSPYFLVWQAMQEVEEEYSRGRRTVAERRGATGPELAASRADVLLGAFASKLITYFITLTAAATLYAAGRHDIGSLRDAASALEPVAGPAAFYLFALGVVGTGILAIPALAGSAAYAVAEAMRWRASLQDRPRIAPKFYLVLAAAVLLGLALIYLGVPAVQLLFWASVLNGLLTAPVILLALLLTRDPAVMGARVNPLWVNFAGWAAVAVSGAAALGMLATLLTGGGAPPA